MERAGCGGPPKSLTVLAWNCGGFAPHKVEESAECPEPLPSRLLVVALWETQCLVACTALAGFVVPAEA